MKTIEEAITLAMKQAAMSRSVNTMRVYRLGMKHFRDYLVEEKVQLEGRINKLSMDYFIYFPAWMAKKELKSCSIGSYLASCRYFLEWLQIHKLIKPDTDELLRYKMARKDTRKRKGDDLKRLPKPGQAEAMLHAAGCQHEESPMQERDLAMIALLYSSGCRANELCTLKVEDMNLEEREALVTGKGERQRKIYYDRYTVDAYSHYLSFRAEAHGVNPNEPAFCRHDQAAEGKSMAISTATVREIVERVRVLAGVDVFTPHYFRHAFAIKMMKETGNLALVQDLLGHSSPTTTRVYAKFVSEDLRDAHRKVFR